MKRDSLQILGFMVLIAIGYGVLLKLTGWKADFSETNFHANMARAHDYLDGPHQPVEILGSSLSTKLLPDYFSKTGSVVGNLGLDGCKVLTGLQLLLQRKDLPETVLLEENMLLQQPTANDREVLDAVGGFSFWLATKIPILQPQSRPSSILYSVTKKRNDLKVAATAPVPHPEEVPATKMTPTNAIAIPPVAASQTNTMIVAGQIEKLIRELQHRGVEVALFHLPEGPMITRAGENDLAAIDNLVRSLGLPTIDLGEEMTRQKLPIRYTDGLHLVSPSAQNAAAILADWLRHSLALPHN
jgi:hypothetical protein